MFFKSLKQMNYFTKPITCQLDYSATLKLRKNQEQNQSNCLTTGYFDIQMKTALSCFSWKRATALAESICGSPFKKGLFMA